SAEDDRLSAEGDGISADGDGSRRRRRVSTSPSADGAVTPGGQSGRRRRVSTSPSAGGAVTPGAPLRVRVRLAERGVDIDLAVEPGQVVAVLGPNGAGKSTLLQAVTGLLPHRARPRSGSPDELHVSIDDTVLTDTTRGTAVPPRRRRIGWLTQRPLLLAHLDAVDDVAFGLRARGTTRPEARATARERLAELDAEHLAGRRPHELSGGQAQRVSIARALATDPRVLLLDEPLASLDVGVAQQVRRALHDAQRAHPRTTLLVTHDLLDVLLLADRAVVLERGRVVEDGPAREVLTRPRSRFAARLAGINLLSGAATDDGGLRLGAGGDAATGTSSASTRSDAQVVAGVVADDGGLVEGDPAVAMFEPRAVAIHREAPSGSPRNAFAVTITSLEPHGQLFRAWGEVAGPREVRDAVGHLAADLTPRSVADLRLAPGERVWFAVKAAEVQVYSTR
ncbi:MAG: modB, partial [Oerskovia sp.]|nr:modB [Oerskovia sp.]